MKKFFSILVALAALVTFQSCEQDETNDDYTAKATTLEATDISAAGCTLHATIEYTGGDACAPSAGIFFGTNETPSHENGSMSTTVITPKNGTTKIDEPVKANAFYYPEPGKKLYYRAYVRVHTPGNNDNYTYGEVKSFVVPEK